MVGKVHVSRYVKRRSPVRFERISGPYALRITGLPEQTNTVEGFKEIVETLMTPTPGGGRFGGPGLIGFQVEGDKNFGIRSGEVVRIPRPGLFDYDSRFRTVDEFVVWLKANKKSGVISWQPYPEDKRFYEPYHALFWFGDE